ncbi:MAG: RNA-binding protein [bacterium]|nr:RNA-binding protein [bacterium]
MSRKVFVGGLSWDTNNDGLRSACEQFGVVEDVRVITDRETGRSRGFGFVTFSSEDEARTAISGLDGSELDGRTIRVNEAEEKRPGGGGGGYGGGRDGGGGGGGYGGGGGGGYGGGRDGGYGGGHGGGRDDRRKKDKRSNRW